MFQRRHICLGTSAPSVRRLPQRWHPGKIPRPRGTLISPASCGFISLALVASSWEGAVFITLGGKKQKRRTAGAAAVVRSAPWHSFQTLATQGGGCLTCGYDSAAAAARLGLCNSGFYREAEAASQDRKLFVEPLEDTQRQSGIRIRTTRARGGQQHLRKRVPW